MVSNLVYVLSQQSNFSFLIYNVDAPITVGLQSSYYSADEDSGDLEVCVEIISGEVDGRTISLSYETIDGSAVGT